MEEIKVIENDNIRIDKYLINYTGITRNKIQKLIENKKILVNNKEVKTSYLVKKDDIITIDSSLDDIITIEKENIKLDIVYEDDYLLVVNKPSGLVVHPGAGNYHHTLVNALMYHCNDNLSKVNGDIRPGIVHRIDADTSGLLVVAKNDIVHNDLAKQIANKSVKRKYLALVHGVIKEDTATIDAPIGRDKNNRKKMSVTSESSKDAITNIKVLERLSDTTLIECILSTGRTHQIRVHMDYINHPVVNDPVYGHKKQVPNMEKFGQMLHAYELGFIHPITKEELDFKVNPPKEFISILNLYKNSDII